MIRPMLDMIARASSWFVSAGFSLIASRMARAFSAPPVSFRRSDFAKLAIRPAALALVALLLSLGEPSSAQTFSNGTNTITVSGTFAASAGSTVSVSGLSGTVTGISLNINNLNVTNLNSVAMVLVPPGGSGLTPLDFFSGSCGAGSQQVGNSTLTIADTGDTGTDNTSGMVPGLGIGTCPTALSGTYLPTDYFPGQDTFNSPGPSTYNSGGTNPSTDGSGTFNFSSFGTNGSSLNGTWALYIANQASSGFTPSGSLGSWTITFSGSSSAATTTTISANPSGSSSLVYTGTDVNGQATAATAVTLTATVSPDPGGGTVTFYDSTGVAAGTGTVLASNVPVSSAQAQTIVTFPGTEEGSRTISATFNGASGSLASTSTTQATVITTNHPYNPSGATFCNGPVKVINNSGGSPYPSLLALGNSFSQLQGTIESVSVTLNGFSLQNGEELDNLGFLLQAPGSNTTGLASSGNAFEFLSWAGSPFASGSLTLSDNGTAEILPFSAPTCTTCQPTDNYIDIGSGNSDSFPSPAPTTYATAAPTGSATFATEFGGLGANNTWSLYLDNRLTEGGTLGSLGSWCLNFTMQASAHPTATSINGSPNPASISSGSTASVTLTANVSVTDTSGLTVNAGTVSFVDGATPLGTSPVSNSGQALLTAPLTEGTHQIVASYSGTNTGTEFGISSATFDQRVNTATRNPTSGSGSGPYTYCNSGAITAPGLGADAGAAAPYPSNIFVTNLPGTVNAVTVTLEGLSTKDQGDLMSLLVGPGGNNLDFFSLTGSNVSNATPPINIIFSDTAASSIAEGSSGNLFTSGTFKPTSYNLNFAYPQCPPNATLCATENVGPPLASNPFTPAKKAATAGTSLLGNANAAGVFGGTSASTYNGNGTWSLYMDDGGPTGGGEQTNITNGWCVNLTANLPSVSVNKSHSGTFTQGQQGVPFTVNIDNNGPGPSGDPTGGNNPLTVTDTLNSVFSYAGFSGTGWSCSPAAQTVTCRNDSSVPQGSSYPVLTIDVNVSPTATTTASIPNQVSVSGGGVKSSTSNTDIVTILPAPVLAVQKSHTGTFTQGQTAQWNISVSNTATAGSTYGTVTVSDTLPAGYTLNSYSSTGSVWGCSGVSVVTCTTTAGISSGAASIITLTVNVPANSPVSVTNSAKAWGGGDLTHSSLATAASATDMATVLQDMPATLTSPAPSSTLSGSSVTFNWTAGTGVTAYWFYLGTTGTRSMNVYSSGSTKNTSVTVNTVPTNGVNIYATLYSLINGTWVPQSYTYTEAGSYTLASMTSPAPGSALSGSSATFNWKPGAGPTAYWLYLGTTGPRSANLFNSGSISGNSVTVNSLPTNGVTIYATLFSNINGSWQPVSYTYTESGTYTLAQITSPAPGSTLAGSSVTFNWSPGAGPTSYYLYLGTTGPNSFNVYNSGSLSGTSVTVSGIPANGGQLFATLFSNIDGAWQPVHGTFVEAGTAVPAAMTSPSPGSTLSGSFATFNWTSGSGVTAYWLYLGTTGPKSANLLNSGVITGTFLVAHGLPTNGVTIYATLFSEIDGVWQPASYTYTESGSYTLANMISPAPGTTLPGASATFNWSASAGGTGYWLYLGSTGPKSANLYSSGDISGTSVTVNGLPTNGGTIYATLFTQINGVWQPVSYMYTAQ